MTHEDDKILISRKTLQLTEPVNFVKRVMEISNGKMTYKEAYLIAEEEYQQIFNRNRYSSYESFRVIKYRITRPQNRAQLSLF